VKCAETSLALCGFRRQMTSIEARARLLRWLLCPLAVPVALALVAAPAQARITAAVLPAPTDAVPSYPYVRIAGDDRDNQLFVVESGDHLIVHAHRSVRAGPRCRLKGPRVVACRFTDAYGYTEVDGMAGDDRLRIDQSVTSGVAISGGRGDDRIDGGSGDDVIIGNHGNDVERGHAGNDAIGGGPALAAVRD